jgi:ABC-type multidrug transport system fused ATPase/permease subunit
MLFPYIEYFRNCLDRIFKTRTNYSRVEDIDPEARINTNDADSKQVIRDFASLILAPENRPIIYATGTLTIFNGMFNYLPSYFLAQAISSVRESQNSEEELPWSESYELFIAAACVTYAASQLTANLREYLMTSVSANSNQKLINLIVRHLVKNKSLEFHNETPFGDHMFLLQKGFSVTNAGTPILNTIMPTIAEITIASLALSQVYGVKVGLNVLTMLAAFTAYSMKTTQPVIDINKEILEKNNLAFENLCKAIKNYKIEHDFGKDEYELHQVSVKVNELFETIVKAQKVSISINNGHILIARAFMLSACLLATTRDPDKLLVLFGYLNQLGTLLPSFGSSVNTLASSYPDIKFVFGELAKQSEVVNEHLGVELSLKPNHNLKFNGIFFSYPKKAKVRILDNFSASFITGKTYALVSESGAGKTTIFNLLYKYYVQGSGSITINDQDISGVDLKSLRGSIALLGQNPCLFAGTLRDNIKYGASNPDSITDTEILDLACKISLKDFICNFEKGLDHEVGEDGKFLSGGQQQRVAILRGLLKDCSIRLLDEVTASLDANTAHAVLRGIISFSKERNVTTIMISHNLIEVSNYADEILVLSDGMVAAKGTHSELLVNSNLYKSLWDKFSSQSPPVSGCRLLS